MDFPLVEGLLVFLVGICIGSFLNVVIYRLPRGKSLIVPGSRCGFCRSSIPWSGNIPILGFFLLGGSCKKCGIAYSFRYPIVEFLMGIMAVALWDNLGFQPILILSGIFVASLIAASFIDIDFKIIPDSISIGGWILAVFLSLLSIQNYPVSFQESLWSSMAGAGFLWLVGKIFYGATQEMGLGGGDIKLIGFVGAFLGIRGVITSISVGSVLGLVAGILFIVICRKSRRTPIPFGPFLAAGALVSIFHLDFWW